jgi:hypothetical protein
MSAEFYKYATGKIKKVKQENQVATITIMFDHYYTNSYHLTSSCRLNNEKMHRHFSDYV